MLKRKRVIVNGASTGIGEQMAYHLARMGAHILVTARTDAKLQEVVTRCLELGAASAHYVSGTMEDEAFAEHVVKEAEEVLENAMKATSDLVQAPAAPKEECTLEIIRGGALRHWEVYYKYATTKIPLLIQDWAPELFDYLIRRSLNLENLKKN